MRCDGFKIATGGDGETGLDDVNAKALELAGDGELFIGVHAAAGRLFTIAQSGIKDEDLVGRGYHVGFHLITLRMSG